MVESGVKNRGVNSKGGLAAEPTGLSTCQPEHPIALARPLAPIRIHPPFQDARQKRYAPWGSEPRQGLRVRLGSPAAQMARRRRRRR